jgi:hypothetical protein
MAPFTKAKTILSALILPLLLAPLLLTGCSTLINESKLSEEQKTEIRVVGLYPDIPVPDGFEWPVAASRVENKGDAADLAAAVLGPFLRVRPPDWDRNADIRKFVQPAALIPETLSRAFAADITNRTRLTLVTNPTDAVFSFKVERLDWRDTIGYPFTAHSKPRLTVYVTLSSTNAVYWQSRVQVAGTYRPAWMLAWHMNTYVRKPEILRRCLTTLSEEAAHILANNFLKAFPSAACSSKPRH